jgi:hypothetical protein
MSNFREHQNIAGPFGGMAAGIAACFYPGASPLQIICESAGGYAAARFTGTLPDVIDPANCWFHRDTGHAVLPVSTVLTGYASCIQPIQQWCRERARAAEVALAAASTLLEACGQLCSAVLWYTAAGTVIGAPVGYAVHIIQDGFTPQGVPLLVRRM